MLALHCEGGERGGVEKNRGKGGGRSVEGLVKPAEQIGKTEQLESTLVNGTVEEKGSVVRR